MKMEEIDFVCISLVSRSDRRKLISELFEKLGILDRINWWIVEKHPQGGMYGCFESHWSVWNASEFTSPYLCVFEDDLIETPDCLWRFYQSIDAAKLLLPKYLDILNLEPGLGYIEKRLTEKNESIEVYQGFFLHLGAYIIHRSSIRSISERTIGWFGIDIDTALYKNCRMGGVLPKVLRQRGEDSDNGGGYRNMAPKKTATAFDGTPRFNDRIPFLNLMALESIQFLAWFYLRTRSGPIEFADRRVSK